jgi:hypothetical protein
MVERKWWPRRDMIWVLVGVTGCIPRPRGIAWLHCSTCPCRLRTVRCMDPGQVTDLLSRAHTYLWEQEGLLLSCHELRLFPDQLIGGGDRWRSKHHFEAGPQVWGLGVQVWTGTWNPWEDWNGLVSFVLGYKRGVCFLGYPAGHIDSRIAVSIWQYGLTTL